MALKPSIIYEDALEKQFRWQGELYLVKHAPPEIFRAFIEHCGRKKHFGSLWTKVLLDELLALIDEQCDGFVRWYCVDTLLAHRVPVALVEAV